MAILGFFNDEYDYNWGYAAMADGLLFGSSVRSGNFYTEGRGPWYDDSGFNNDGIIYTILEKFSVELSKKGAQ